MKTQEKNFVVTDEYGKWMVELIPISPLEDFLYSGNLIFYTKNMYQQMEKIVNPDHLFLSYPVPPKLGTRSYVDFIDPGKTLEETKLSNKVSKSPFMKDDFINSHPRFPTFTANVGSRRGENPVIEGNIFKDKNTDLSVLEDGNREPGKIYLDAFTFGMGLCSLQITFGVANLTQARWLYDQFHVFTPIFVV